MSAWTAAPGGVALRVTSQPRLAPGTDGPRPRIAVTASAEHGRANVAVRDALALALQVQHSGNALRQGATSRPKSFHVVGDAAALIARPEAFA